MTNPGEIGDTGGDSIGDVRLIHGACEDVLAGLPAESVDAIVTDPPYGINMMNRKWDYDVPTVAQWEACLRVLKPGGHLLSFAGTRTQHRMAVRIEDAGFEIRDMIAWVYGSGFPKSLDVSKAIDKRAGVEREILGPKMYAGGLYSAARLDPGGNTCHQGYARPWKDDPEAVKRMQVETAPATDAAQQWAGYGTALKPAFEPVTVARKPIPGTVADNVLRYGTGALNIDGCRVPSADGVPLFGNGRREAKGCYSDGLGCDGRTGETSHAGRWPANLIHDGSEEVVGLFPQTTSGKLGPGHIDRGKATGTYGEFQGRKIERDFGGDSGSAARFFYCPKSSRADRGPSNDWPTVKPTDLMRYLVRLVTPPGGVVLDPWMGSGSTGKAAVLEGFRFLGIDKDAHAFEIAGQRVEGAKLSRHERAEDGQPDEPEDVAVDVPAPVAPPTARRPRPKSSRRDDAPMFAFIEEAHP